MPAYLITHKVRTVADLDGVFQLDGFTLDYYSGETSDEAWTISETLTADTFLTAFNTSRQRLLPLVDALAFTTQCAFSLAGMSFMVRRIDDNPDCVVYFRHVKPRKTVGMTLWQKEQAEDVSRLLTIENKAALRYFREAANAATSSACLAMLTTAAEALAGQTKITGACENCAHPYERGGTDRAKLEAILGPEANKELYKKKGSLRNRLMHGHSINEDEAAALCGEAYKRILLYLKTEFKLTTIEEIVGAPRRFDSLEWFGAFVRCKSDYPPLLRELEQGWQKIGELIDQPVNY